MCKVLDQRSGATISSHNDGCPDCRKQRKVARALIIANHYLHRGSSSKYVFTARVDDEIVGVVWFGVGASSNARKSVCPSDPTLTFELTRLWIKDDAAINASQFLSAVLTGMPKCIVFSFADTSQDHLGGVYLACSFNYAGWTGMMQKAPLKDVPTTNNMSARATKSSVPFKDWDVRTTKIRYWKVAGPVSKVERKRFNALCGWGSYDHRILERPIGHRQATKDEVARAIIPYR